MHSDILFRTSRFNLSQPQSYFINACCFGDDLAKWLVAKLQDAGTEIERAPYQEDWGWEFAARLDSGCYYIGIGGNSDENPANPNLGEWRIMFTKRRTILERLTGKNKLPPDDAMMSAVESTLAQEPDFTEVHREL